MGVVITAMEAYLARVLYNKLKVLSKGGGGVAKIVQMGGRFVEKSSVKRRGEINGSRSSSSTEWERTGQEETRAMFPTSETRLPSRLLDEFSPLSGESGV